MYFDFVQLRQRYRALMALHDSGCADKELVFLELKSIVQKLDVLEVGLAIVMERVE